MKNPLELIPGSWFEGLGVMAGLSTSVLIAFQIYEEYTSSAVSTITPVYLYGWIVVFSVWLIYGLKFRCLAVWVTNLIALILQLILVAVILLK